MLIKRSCCICIYFIAVALYFYFPRHVISKISPILILIAFVYSAKLSIREPEPGQSQHWQLNELILALSFSLLGDLVLSFPGKLGLTLGILFFSLAHFAYISCFIKKGLVRKRRILIFLPFLFLILLNFYFLFPYFATLQFPATCYVLILTALMFFGLQLRESSFIVALGCFFFLVSDFNLAINEFVSSSKKFQWLTLFFYYLSQLFLVTGLCHLRLGYGKKISRT